MKIVSYDNSEDFAEDITVYALLNYYYHYIGFSKD